MQTRVREQFALVAGEVAKRHGDERWSEISAEGTVDEVEASVWEQVERVVVGVEEGDAGVGRLWV